MHNSYQIQDEAVTPLEDGIGPILVFSTPIKMSKDILPVYHLFAGNVEYICKGT